MTLERVSGPCIIGYGINRVDGPSPKLGFTYGIWPQFSGSLSQSFQKSPIKEYALNHYQNPYDGLRHT